MDIWKVLQGLSRFELSAVDNGSSEHCGNGLVVVTQPDDYTIIFSENGSWTGSSAHASSFSNIYRWSLVAESNLIRLAHLRHGPDRPVDLADLLPADDGSWRSVEAFVCGEDSYRAAVSYTDQSLNLVWTVKGPAKRQRIQYFYS
jgi:hypothetical protein